jgi:hypothetical protein
MEIGGSGRLVTDPAVIESICVRNGITGLPIVNDESCDFFCKKQDRLAFALRGILGSFGGCAERDRRNDLEGGSLPSMAM